MKRIIFLLTTIITLAAACHAVSADTFNNASFIGDWISKGATETNFAKLRIDFCDSNCVQAHFSYTKNGKQTFIYKLYQGQVNDTKAKLHFDLFRPSDMSAVIGGTMTLTFNEENIHIDAVTDAGETVYSGIVGPENSDFDPYKSPYSYNVNICLNGQEFDFEPKPVILNSHTFVPLRNTFDAMGINVYWDSYEIPTRYTQMITATRGINTILQLSRSSYGFGLDEWYMYRWNEDNPDTYYKDHAVEVDISEVQPIIIGTSSYVPLRVIAESFGADIGWDDGSHTVSISFDNDGETSLGKDAIAATEDFSMVRAANILGGYTILSSDPHPYFNSINKYYRFTVADDANGSKNITVSNDGRIE